MEGGGAGPTGTAEVAHFFFFTDTAQSVGVWGGGSTLLGTGCTEKQEVTCNVPPLR